MTNITRQAAGTVIGAIAGVALGITLERLVFECWPWWATGGLSVVLGLIAFWLFRPPDPDRGKTYWEKRAPELEEVAAHLRAVRFRETLRHFAKTLDGLGIPRPNDGALQSDLSYVWERYLYLFIDKVRLGNAANLRPVAANFSLP